MSGILVVAEQRRGELRPSSLELITAAQPLRRPGDEVGVAVLGNAPERHVSALSLAGIDEIIILKTATAELLMAGQLPAKRDYIERRAIHFLIDYRYAVIAAPIVVGLIYWIFIR